jgi:hypothetical protein
MEDLLERARACLNAMEADRQTALALSEQKAEEAKLIKARQQGFQAAMEILCGQTSADVAGSLSEAKEPSQRRTRRRIPELIERELSYSGQAMTVRQIAKAIDYNSERTEIVLKRMEEAGQLLRNERGQWTIPTANRASTNGHAANPAVAHRQGRSIPSRATQQ